MSLKVISRIGVALLFVLSLLGYFYIANLFAWELSIVTTELGSFLALATIVIWLVGRPRDLMTLALTIATIALFTAPTIQALLDHPGEVSVSQLFSPVENPVAYTRFVFNAANGKTPLNLDYYAPTEPQKSAPWVVVIHGGGWINGDSLQLPELNWHLAKQGYAVMSIDYRLAPGWIWPAQKDDVTEALKFIRAHADDWHLDPKRWVILGRSAGAQIAGAVAYSLHGDDKPKGFISFYNPTDQTYGYEVGAEDDILRSRTLLRQFLGGTPQEQPKNYASASVLQAVSGDACPTLVIHGMRDTIVYVKHSERLYDSLQKHNIPAQLLLMRYGPHGFDYFFNGPEAQVATSAVDRFLLERFH